ncbi:hypothetical protein KIPB_002390, partial [Kipferlia bialata]|eukprot:g2390.t1
MGGSAEEAKRSSVKRRSHQALNAHILSTLHGIVQGSRRHSMKGVCESLIPCITSYSQVLLTPMVVIPCTLSEVAFQTARDALSVHMPSSLRLVYVEHTMGAAKLEQTFIEAFEAEREIERERGEGSEGEGESEAQAPSEEESMEGESTETENSISESEEEEEEETAVESEGEKEGEGEGETVEEGQRGVVVVVVAPELFDSSALHNMVTFLINRRQSQSSTPAAIVALSRHPAPSIATRIEPPT